MNREEILALRARCFGDVDREKLDPAFWDWEFARGPLGPARIVTEEDASHIAMVPLSYAIDGEVVRGELAVDAMTAPEARGRGLMTRVVRQATQGVATAYQIRDEILGAMLRGGWTVAEKVPVLVKPAWFSWGKAEAESIGPEEMARIATQQGCSVARTADFLRWRFFENPRWTYRVTGNGGAYLVARRTTLKGFDTMAIVDLAWRDRKAAKALLSEVVRHAKSEGCTLAAALVSRAHPAFGLFILHGFMPGPHRFRLLVHPPELARKTWRVMWADTDHL